MVIGGGKMERHNPEQPEKTTEVLQDAVEDGIVNEQLTLIFLIMKK